MSLTELMSAMDLDVYPQAALVIFLGVWILVVRRLFTRTGAAGLAAAASLPLDDAPLAPAPVPPRKPS